MDILKDDKIVRLTFSTTYTLLLTTGAVCLIEALTTKDAKIELVKVTLTGKPQNKKEEKLRGH